MMQNQMEEEETPDIKTELVEKEESCEKDGIISSIKSPDELIIPDVLPFKNGSDCKKELQIKEEVSEPKAESDYKSACKKNEVDEKREDLEIDDQKIKEEKISVKQEWKVEKKEGLPGDVKLWKMAAVVRLKHLPAKLIEDRTSSIATPELSGFRSVEGGCEVLSAVVVEEEPDSESHLAADSRNSSESYFARQQPTVEQETLDSPDGNFTCHHCGKNVKNRRLLEGHIKRTHLKLLPCSVCGTKFGYKSELVKHNRDTHLQIKSFFCELCGKGFSIKKNLEVHKNVHFKIKPFTCKECNTSFGQLVHLKVHQATRHSDVKPFSCENCGKSFKLRSNLREHSKTHLSSEDRKKFTCEICNQSLRTLQALKGHIMIHKKTLQCLICQKPFSSRYSLTVHQNVVHQGSKTFNCKFCWKSFGYKNALNLHIQNVHKQLKLFECKICALSLSSKSHLNRHQRVHKNEKTRAFICPTCGKSFRFKDELKSHRDRTHSETDLKCTICMKSYKYKNDLKRHLLSHSQTDELQCDVCGKKLMHKSSMKRHTQGHLNLKP